MLRLLHLSDIHFSDLLEGKQDIDIEHSVRERMLVDISRMCDQLGQVDAVLVVGDIASRGKSEEYEIAQRFLAQVTELSGCPRDRVICVPGNHDVDRDRQNAAHAAFRHQLRTMETPHVSDGLVELLQDENSASILLHPFDAYNRFALAYGCDFSQEQPVMSPKILDLGSRSLYVHGINSVWISDGSESPNSDSAQLVCGLFQVAAVGRDPEAVSLTLYHHPPRWLRDVEEIEPWVCMSHIVLTGHEHEAGIRLSEDGRTLFVASGAVNPYRTEGAWIPAYNVLELRTSGDQDEVLEVAVYPRRWRGNRAEFGHDDTYPEAVRAELQILMTSAEVDSEVLAASSDRVTEQELEDEGSVQIPQPQPVDSSRHSHIFSIMRAPPDRRRRIARDLGLLTSPDLVGLEADREIIRAGLASGRLSDLAARLVGGPQ